MPRFSRQRISLPTPRTLFPLPGFTPSAPHPRYLSDSLFHYLCFSVSLFILPCMHQQLSPLLSNPFPVTFFTPRYYNNIILL